MATINAHSDDPVGVLEATATQQDLVRPDRKDAPVFEPQVAFKLIEEFVWSLAVDRCSV